MKIYMAPMEGLTGYIYRNAYEQIFGKGRISKYFIPFISPNQSEKFLAKELRDIDSNNNKDFYAVPQIMTNKVSDFLWTAKMLKEEYNYSEININAGCPSGTVVSKNRGSGILKDVKALDEFLYGIFESRYVNDNNLKISVKTRLGVESPLEFEDILEVYNKYPLHELIIHPRVRTDYYRNTVNMKAFTEAVKNCKMPVCYNGDIFTRKDYIKFMEEIKPYSSVDAVMLGRGLIADPGLIDVLTSDSPSEYIRDLDCDKDRMHKLHDTVYNEYLKIMSGDKHAIHRMKEMWCYMDYVFDDCKKEIKAIKKSQKMADYQDAVKVFFNNAKLAERDHISFTQKF